MGCNRTECRVTRKQRGRYVRMRDLTEVLQDGDLKRAERNRRKWLLKLHQTPIRGSVCVWSEARIERIDAPRDFRGASYESF
jgi:hypothetical protein